MANLTAQQRYGLGAAPAGAAKPMGGLAQKRKTKAVTVSGKPKAFAGGGAIQPSAGVLGSVLRQSPATARAPAAAPYGNRMIQKYAEGGKVEGKEPIPRIEVTAKRMTPAEAKAYDDAQKQPEAQRTVNGAPIHNPRPANLPVGSGGVRG